MYLDDNHPKVWLMKQINSHALQSSVSKSLGYTIDDVNVIN